MKDLGILGQIPYFRKIENRVSVYFFQEKFSIDIALEQINKAMGNII